MTDTRFATLPLSASDRAMLQDAYDAVSAVSDGWEFLRTYEPTNGFMFSSHPTLDAINAAMTYDGHSGASYGWTMRAMEFIAKKGWDAYCAMF